MQHQIIQLKKDGNSHELYYENDETSFDIPIEEDQYTRIFEKIQPNFSFSTPDKMIQDHIKDGSIFPTFKNGNMFNEQDMQEIMEKAKKEMNTLIQYNKNCRDDVRTKIKNTTKKGMFKKKKKPNKKNSTNKVPSNPKPKSKAKPKPKPKAKPKPKPKAKPKAKPKLPPKKYKNKSKNK